MSTDWIALEFGVPEKLSALSDQLVQTYLAHAEKFSGKDREYLLDATLQGLAVSLIENGMEAPAAEIFLNFVNAKIALAEFTMDFGGTAGTC